MTLLYWWVNDLILRCVALTMMTALLWIALMTMSRCPHCNACCICDSLHCRPQDPYWVDLMHQVRLVSDQRFLLLKILRPSAGCFLMHVARISFFIFLAFFPKKGGKWDRAAILHVFIRRKLAAYWGYLTNPRDKSEDFVHFWHKNCDFFFNSWIICMQRDQLNVEQFASEFVMRKNGPS